MPAFRSFPTALVVLLLAVGFTVLAGTSVSAQSSAGGRDRLAPCVGDGRFAPDGGRAILVKDQHEADKVTQCLSAHLINVDDWAIEHTDQELPELPAVDYTATPDITEGVFSHLVVIAVLVAFPLLPTAFFMLIEPGAAIVGLLAGAMCSWFMAYYVLGYSELGNELGYETELATCLGNQASVDATARHITIPESVTNRLTSCGLTHVEHTGLYLTDRGSIPLYWTVSPPTD